MRSLELELEGFTSFRSRQTLDFSNLDLFAITGPTGAGKTSLLDGITFALYGHVARFGKDATVKELVSQGKENLKVSFRFGVRGVEYRVTRTWRKRGKTDESKVLLESWRNSNWEKLETKETTVTKRVKEVLGMDFETFTRVILLPQGKFDEFIKGDRTKRRSILRDLAGFAIFERMHKQANEQAKLYNNEYKFLDRQLADLQLPPPEVITAKEQELINIEAELSILNQEVIKAEKTLAEVEELFKNITRLTKLQDDLKQFNAQGKEIENLKIRLRLAQAADQIQGEYALVQNARNRAKQTQTATLLAQKRLTQAQEELAQQKFQLDQFMAKQQEITSQIKQREIALNAAQNHELQRQQHQTELKRANKNQKQRQNTLDLAVQAIKDLLPQLEAAKQKAEAGEKELIAYTSDGGRLQQLQQISSMLGNWKILEEQTIKSRKKLEQTTLEKQKCEKSYQDGLVKLEQAKILFEEQDKLFQVAEAANQKAIQSNHVAALREILHHGDRCPVCHGTYQSTELLPLPAVTLVETKELLENRTKAEQAEKAAENHLTVVGTKLENLKQKEWECSQELIANQDNLTEISQKITLVLDTDVWQVDALNQELKILQENSTKYQEALVKQQETTAKVIQIQQNLDGTMNNHNTAEIEYQAATQEVERWQKSLQAIEIKLNEITGGKSYAKLQTALEQEKQALEQEQQKLTNSYQIAEKKVIQGETEAQEASNKAKEELIQQEQLEAIWETALKNANLDQASFIQAQANALEQANWQTVITDYNNERVKLETQVEEVKLQVGDRTIDESTIKSQRDKQRILAEKFQKAQNQRANLKGEISTIKSQQEQGEKLTRNLAEVREKAQTYSTLGRSLKSDEFQAYILEHLETDLVTRATETLLQLTDSRYTLRLQDGDYWVEDNWNGGESRRVQTLSGGETFATSLSMALALSEKLSMGAELGSLFLDEGFGTLDGDTLESVTQILESLRQQDKLIGVITHVKALGERLPTQVKVYKSPEGSKIEVEVF